MDSKSLDYKCDSDGNISSISSIFFPFNVHRDRGFGFSSKRKTKKFKKFKKFAESTLIFISTKLLLKEIELIKKLLKNN